MPVSDEPDIKDRLKLLAASTLRSKPFVAEEAIRESVELNEWQTRETLMAEAGFVAT